MAMSIKAAYAPIDIHKGNGWPDVVPPLTEKDAINAVRRLYRFSCGSWPYSQTIKITSGNRRAADWRWDGDHRCFFINPGKGWAELIHDLSHDFDYIVNGSSSHNKHHARFERKLIKEVIKRGWLETKPEPAPKATVTPINNTEAKRKLALERIEARIVNWDRKARRAKTALAKLAKQERYYRKALGL